ncbi:MAG: hypothetical protein P1V20_12420 [Verrucomicrobiales bacterium]|nr:hypothetical protein [Verrucomicrobiales bacterium]
MASNKISYPHPVLGNGDDISVGEISPTVAYKISDEAIHLTFENLTTYHSEIDQMLEKGDAVWHLRIQCSRTYMRENFSANNSTFDIRLKGEDYEGIVDVDITVVAKKDIPDYHPKGLHDDYEEENFQLCVGEVIGIAPTFKFLVDKVYDPLKAPVSSLVRITQGEHDCGPFTLTLDDDLIIVRLSKSDWNEYAGIRDRVPTIIHSAIVVPALAEAILHINEHKDSLWGGRLNDLLQANEISVDAPLAAAQEILASPITRTFNEVNATLDNGEI